ncbi:hypothetical protein SGPA1_11732 [Streptomyces misionensis JCM 4497]
MPAAEPREVSRVPAPQPTEARRLVRPQRRGRPHRPVRRLPVHRALAGRGVERAPCRGRERPGQDVPLPRLRPADPLRRPARGRLARPRGRRRPPPLAQGLLEREGPPHHPGAAVP